MEEAEELADHVVIIDHGRVVADGSPRQLTAEQPDAAQLRFRARAGLDLTELCTALPDGCRIEEPTPGAYLLTGRVDPQVVSAVTAWCAQQGVLAEELHVGRRSLEDVFLELTGTGTAVSTSVPRRHVHARAGPRPAPAGCCSCTRAPRRCSRCATASRSCSRC